MRELVRPLALAAVVVAAMAAPAFAQKDTVRVGAAAAPTIRVSEDTVINYTGVVPATFTGALDADDSTYNRAVSCASLSGVGTAVPFDTVTITNSSPGTANVMIQSELVGGGACTDSNDTFFTLYNGTFNPAAALTNCLAVNDDISGATNRCSRLTFSIPVGETRVVTVAGFNNAASANGLFSYQISFAGTTPVELIDFEID